MRLSRLQQRLVYLLGGGTLVTGLLWLLFEYTVRLQSDFGAEHHWLQPWWMRLHGALAMLAVWGFGALWSLHIRQGWAQQPSQRRSGANLFAVVAWLGLSGLLLYYTGSDSVRSWISLAHWLVGIAAPLALLVHLAGARRLGHFLGPKR